MWFKPLMQPFVWILYRTFGTYTLWNCAWCWCVVTTHSDLVIFSDISDTGRVDSDCDAPILYALTCPFRSWMICRMNHRILASSHHCDSANEVKDWRLIGISFRIYGTLPDPLLHARILNVGAVYFPYCNYAKEMVWKEEISHASAIIHTIFDMLRICIVCPRPHEHIVCAIVFSIWWKPFSCKYHIRIASVHAPATSGLTNASLL